MPGIRLVVDKKSVRILLLWLFLEISYTTKIVVLERNIILNCVNVFLWRQALPSTGQACRSSPLHWLERQGLPR